MSANQLVGIVNYVINNYVHCYYTSSCRRWFMQWVLVEWLYGTVVTLLIATDARCLSIVYNFVFLC